MEDLVIRYTICTKCKLEMNSASYPMTLHSVIAFNGKAHSIWLCVKCEADRKEKEDHMINNYRRYVYMID